MPPSLTPRLPQPQPAHFLSSLRRRQPGPRQRAKGHPEASASSPQLRISAFGICLLATLFVGGLGDASSAFAAEVPTHTVKKGVLQTKVQFDAVLEATEMSPVRIQAKAVPELTVLEAVPHGARVTKGQTLLKIDTEKLREQIEDLELDRPASTLALELAEAELTNLSLTTPFKLEATKRAQRVATEDLAYFETVGRANREKSITFNVKGAEQRLEGAREELKQLKKMYEADDLTEETEEIILKRQKNAVESSEFFLESSKLAADQSLKTGLPREYEALRTAKRDQDVAASYAEETLARTLTKKRLDFEKSKRDQKKADKRLAELKKDLEETTLTSPMDGLVYYGACEDGKWPTGAAVAKRLVPGGKLAAREVVMTVVNPARLVLRATVTEADVGKLKVGTDGHASPVSAADRKMTVTVESLGEVPLPGGGFETRLSVGKTDGARLVPGMNCKVTLSGSRGAGQTQVVVAPKNFVFGEGADRFVYLSTKSGPEKHAVKVGSSDDRNIEIEEGLEAGDKILTRKPD